MSNSFPLPQRVDTRRRRRRIINEVTNSNSETETFWIIININLKAGDKNNNTLITNIPGGSSYHAPQFEYTNDHPADVQLHAWGENLIESLNKLL